MIVCLILMVIFQLMIGLSKAVADITEHSDNWNISIFSRFEIESFFGAKDRTWKRKYNFPKWIRNHIVMFSDIWHLSNTFRFFYWIMFSIMCYIVGANDFFSFIWIILLSVVNRFSFHLFYMYWLRK